MCWKNLGSVGNLVLTQNAFLNLPCWKDWFNLKMQCLLKTMTRRLRRLVGCGFGLAACLVLLPKQRSCSASSLFNSSIMKRYSNAPAVVNLVPASVRTMQTDIRKLPTRSTNCSTPTSSRRRRYSNLTSLRPCQTSRTTSPNITRTTSLSNN